MSQIQAIIFNKKENTKRDVKKWIRKHKITPLKEIHKTENYYRVRIKDPKEFKHFITKNIEKGIKAVIGIKKNLRNLKK